MKKTCISRNFLSTFTLCNVYKGTIMNKNISIILAAAMTVTAATSCATSKQRSTQDTDKQATPNVDSPDMDDNYLTFSDAQNQALRGINNFGFKLMRTQIGMDSKVVSPLSVSFLMGMLANGADGTTQTEITQTLGVDKVGLDALNETCKALISTTTKPNDKVKISIANCVAVDNSITLNTSYVEQMKALYNAEVSSRDFAKASTLTYINDWCSKHTNGMIPRIIDKLSDSDKAVLMNAVYFNGTWQNKFSKSETREENFRGYSRDIKRVKMMHAKGKRMYAQMDGYRVLSLPYAGNDYQMMVILPNEDCAITDVMDALDADALENINKSMEEYQVDVKLPRFTISTQTPLNKVVSQLGSPSMFQAGKANFSNMAQQSLFVSTMLQKARIEVTEEGTKAAAVTIATMMATSLGPTEVRKVNFHADHPFIYMITHQSTGAILFMGEYTGDDL